MKKLFVILSFLSLTAAYGQAKQGTVKEPVKSQLNAVLESYIDLKNALVSSDEKKSKDKATELLSNIDKVNESKMDEAQKEVYSKAKPGLKSHTLAITKSENIDKQRESFNPLSDVLFEVLKAVKVSDTPVYRAYCPMANDNHGAYWISEKKEIANPYFGSMMLKCGEVKQTL